MTTQEREQAKTMLKKGMSFREVEDLTGIPKSTLQRAFPKDNALDGDDDTNDTDNDGLEGSALRRIQHERDHERQLARIDLEKQRLANERQKLDNEAFALRLKETELEQRSDEGMEKRIRRKGTLLAKYKVLLGELLDNAVDSTWGRDEVEEFIERCEDLKERIQIITSQIGRDEEELAIWHNLNYLIEFVEEVMEEQTGNLIEFDLTKDERRYIESLKLIDFDEQYDGEDESDDEKPVVRKKGR